MIKGSFKRYIKPDGGREGSKFCYGVSVMPFRNADKIFIWPISRETYL